MIRLHAYRFRLKQYYLLELLHDLRLKLDVYVSLQMHERLQHTLLLNAEVISVCPKIFCLQMHSDFFGKHIFTQDAEYNPLFTIGAEQMF